MKHPLVLSLAELFTSVDTGETVIDGQQSLQYQQNQQSSLTSNYWTQKLPQYMTLKIQVLAWDKHKKCGKVNR